MRVMYSVLKGKVHSKSHTRETMPLDPELDSIDGAQELYDRFGYWPSFHDAEIISLHLSRASPSSLIIHTREMTDQLDERNFYVLTK